jgi:ferredoxin
MLLVHRRDLPPLRARRVVIAIGRTGSHRRLGVPGEERDRVHHRLHDPRDYRGQAALVVGGGDSALEAAIALVLAGARVTLVHRGDSFARAKPENQEKLERLRRDPGADVSILQPSDELAATAAGEFMGAREAERLDVRLATRVARIGAAEVTLVDGRAREHTLANDVVFLMLGRDAPLDFFRRSGLRIAGEMSALRWTGLALFVLFCVWLYDWKSGGRFDALFRARGWFPYNLGDLLATFGQGVQDAASSPDTLLGTLAISAAGPAFWYTLAYTAVVVLFGVRRIRRRRTPYVTAQTLTLMAIQVFPLFLLPEILLPLLDARGHLPSGLADALFPRVDYGHGREFWRAYGLILAWPLDVYNVFTRDPLPAWLAISAVQTCVLIPLAIYFFGKGAYCGWICSCGALAETLGDGHRHKMPHGPGWNRLNLAGQVLLGVAVLILMVRIAGWVLPAGNALDRLFDPWLKTPYQWGVDVFLAGVVGYGLYFWFSGRVWCRFFCPLAALMHVYARFGSFRILAEKKKCISCGLCTSACHQGIDVMSFANKGIPMADPQCVRCSACVQVCPTGVLAFGRVDRSERLIGLDALASSPVRLREGD